MDSLSYLWHPEEIVALAKYKLFGCATTRSRTDMSKMDDDMRTCYELLKQTSRSFSAVIMALDDELRYAVCIYYLVLRALDTLEDDMSIPVDAKVPQLKTFHEKLFIPGWNYTKSRDKDRVVLERFDVISSEFRKLTPPFQEVISESCRKMGHGMTIYLDNEINTYQEWNEYCHYVAGLVGIGLSKLFVAAGLEDSSIGEDERLANSMGLFLQKTNIIRDYYGDIPQNRYFWPREAWSEYADKLPQLAEKNYEQGAVACLNELVTNALGHLPDVMLYLSRLRNRSVFNFCAIPQMMAIATLERCYNNPDVFHKNVKIRKGEAVLLMGEATNMNMVKAFMFHYAHQLNNKISPNDPQAERTRLCLTQGLKSTFYPCSRITTVTGDLLCIAVVSLVLWKYGNIVRSLQKGRL